MTDVIERIGSELGHMPHPFNLIGVTNPDWIILLVDAALPTYGDPPSVTCLAYCAALAEAAPITDDLEDDTRLWYENLGWLREKFGIETPEGPVRYSRARATSGPLPRPRLGGAGEPT